MPVYDLWENYSRAEIKEAREKNAFRYQRRWREGTGRAAKQRKKNYKEDQHAQAVLDDATHRANPKARAIRDSSITVAELIDRHVATKQDRAKATIEANQNHAMHVKMAFGDRLVPTLEPTEIEVWATRPNVAARSRKKHIELLRAAIKRGIRDGIVEKDPTEGIIVALGHSECPHLSYEELMAVLDATASAFDRALLGVQGLMGLRLGEAQSLRVGSLAGNKLRVRTSGVERDQTKTRAGIRVLPIPAVLLTDLQQLAGDRDQSEWLFRSPRKAGRAIGSRYITDTLARSITKANKTRSNKMQRITVHGLRHTFAAITLSELGADVMSVSRALGHSRPSTTLNFYGHLAPSGLDGLMEGVDGLAKKHSDEK